MSKLSIWFNGNSYEIEESLLTTASTNFSKYLTKLVEASNPPVEPETPVDPDEPEVTECQHTDTNEDGYCGLCGEAIGFYYPGARMEYPKTPDRFGSEYDLGVHYTDQLINVSYTSIHIGMLAFYKAFYGETFTAIVDNDSESLLTPLKINPRGDSRIFKVTLKFKSTKSEDFLKSLVCEECINESVLSEDLRSVDIYCNYYAPQYDTEEHPIFVLNRNQYGVISKYDLESIEVVTIDYYQENPDLELHH